MIKATAYIDGSGNSSRIQACAVVMYYDDRWEEVDQADRTVVRRTELLPRNTTNNVGEYSGLLLAIRLAKELGVSTLHIRTDSRLIENHINRRWRCKDDRLRRFRDHALKEIQSFHEFSIHWIPREENSEADELCRKAIRAAELAAASNNPFLRPRSHSLPVART